MIRSKKQLDISNLCDLHTPPSLDDELTMLTVYGLGMGPLEPQAMKRVPYDSLYLKQKASRDYWTH